MKTLLPLLIFLILAPLTLSAQDTLLLTGRAVSITDGDTFTLLTEDKQQLKIRLAEIDTPERRQPYGQRAKQALSDFIFNQEVTVYQINSDRYGRIIGRVYRNCDTLDISAALLITGAAWVYRRYCRDESLYPLETTAKANQMGLWALPEAQRQPPWEWRK